MPATMRDQITEFESQAASLLAGFATAASVSKAGLEDNLRQVGVTAKVTATGDAVKVEVEVPEHPGFHPGETPEEFTEAARARRAEKYLAKRKAAVWKAVKKMTGLTPEQKVEALRGLGYGDANLPSQKTQVTAEVAAGTSGYRGMSFTLDGEHTEAEVRDRLEAVAEHTPDTALILAAYPDATGFTSKVRYLSVHAELTWPANYTA